MDIDDINRLVLSLSISNHFSNSQGVEINKQLLIYKYGCKYLCNRKCCLQK